MFENSGDITNLVNALQSELDSTQVGAGLNENGEYVAPEQGEHGYGILQESLSLNDAIVTTAYYIERLNTSVNYVNAFPKDLPENDSLVISGVKQVEGLLNAVTSKTVDLKLAGYANDGTENVGAIDATDTIGSALNKLENSTSAGVKLSEKDGNQIIRLVDDAETANVDEDGLYSHVEIAKLTAAEITALNDSNVREAYKLYDSQDSDANAIGDIIKIYKDSALTDVFIGHTDDALTVNEEYVDKITSVVNGSGSEALCFVYHLEDGTYILQAVNLESFLQESEFGNGFQLDGSTHVVSVKSYDGITVDANGVGVNVGNGLEIDSTTKAVTVKKDSSSSSVYISGEDDEPTQAEVLVVGADGIGVSNVQDAINYATGNVLGVKAGGHVTVTQSRDNNVTGLYNYTIQENDIASETMVNNIIGQTLGNAMSYTGNPTIIGKKATNTITSDLEALDAAVAGLQGGGVGSLTNSNAAISINVSNNDASIGLVLDSEDNALAITDDGLFLSNTVDCGTY